MIRSYDDEDLQTCRELWVYLTEHHRELYNSPGIGGDNPGLQFDDHLARVGAEHIWLAEAEGTVVGMAGLIPENPDGSAELEPIVVLPEARGRGVGQELVEHVLRVAREKGSREVVVRAVGRNAESMRFYHEMGFDTLGYVEFIHDFRPIAEQPWRLGERIADRRFRV